MTPIKATTSFHEAHVRVAIIPPGNKPLSHLNTSVESRTERDLFLASSLVSVDFVGQPQLPKRDFGLFHFLN